MQHVLISFQLRQIVVATSVALTVLMAAVSRFVYAWRKKQTLCAHEHTLSHCTHTHTVHTHCRHTHTLVKRARSTFCSIVENLGISAIFHMSLSRKGKTIFNVYSFDFARATRRLVCSGPDPPSPARTTCQAVTPSGSRPLLSPTQIGRGSLNAVEKYMQPL